MDKKTKMKTYALKAAKGALTGYKRSLIGRVVLADAAIGGIEKYQRKNSRPSFKAISQNSVKTEDKNMKNFIAGLTVLAAAGATLGAAGYYIYKKIKNEEEYDDLIYTDEVSEEDGEPSEDISEESEIKEETAESRQEETPETKEEKPGVKEVVGAIADELVGAAHDAIDGALETADNIKDIIDSAVSKK